MLLIVLVDEEYVDVSVLHQFIFSSAATIFFLFLTRSVDFCPNFGLHNLHPRWHSQMSYFVHSPEIYRDREVKKPENIHAHIHIHEAGLDFVSEKNRTKQKSFDS